MVTSPSHPRVLIVSEHASLAFGGEAALPLHFFRGLFRRGVPVWLIVHERTRRELEELLPEAADRILYVPDTSLNRLMWKLGARLPKQISYLTFGYISRVASQRLARQMARDLVRKEAITIVHQPIPVSPREPSLLKDMGAPVIMGPMNGNMSFPDGFEGSVKGKQALGLFVGAGRAVSSALHRLMPGKLQASALIVANDRTATGLPKAAKGDVLTLVENGVDLAVWSPPQPETAPNRDGTRFVFMGRLVDWKAVDVLVEAMARLPQDIPATLEIIGNGPMRPSIEAAVQAAGLSDRVTFAGWLPQSECAKRIAQADALVLPSIYECGGAVVLEAMACSLPVIATAWGGPVDYLNEECGILVPPTSRAALVEGFAAAMTKLAADPELRRRMGEAGRARIVAEFDWNTKIDRILEIYGRYSR
ncbi:glycosyltransferase family 4 protein [Falsirhodobacter deserti]|uniref:glycosyltransferase family 4 protein n=1 Tax=Falsirhodobacter deserti TaxID=1365611 RepID=UPI000FE2DFE2|nr:glycosyltransferase family 4 protein [Falsirhodobacter deserti]